MSGAATCNTPNTDLMIEQWALVAKELPPAPGGGREWSVDRREIVNAILYRLRTGWSRDMLPHDIPPGGMPMWRRSVGMRATDRPSFLLAQEDSRFVNW